MEESITVMKRMMLVFIAGLLAVAAAAATAEEADAEWTGETYVDTASAEGTCAHEHTVTAYYFDAPEYFPLDGEDHLVLGPAIVEVTCQDCGAVLSVTSESNAQETRSHVFRNGVCALCGYEQAAWAEASEAAAPAARAAEAPEESVLPLTAGEDDPNQYFCTLTGTDLENAGDTLVLRPDGRNTAIVVKTDEVRREIDGAGTFIVQIGKPGDQYVSTSIRMFDAFGAETAPDGEDIFLRIYAENNGMPLTVTFTDPYGFTTVEEASWSVEGYWVATWHGDGLYEIR